MILACSAYGFQKANKLEKRKRSIGFFKNAFIIMKNEMEFSKRGVGEIFCAVGKKCESEEVGQIFLNAAKKTKQKPQNIFEIWQEEIENNKNSLCLSNEEADLIEQVFSQLGKTNYILQKEMMQRAVSAAEMLCDTANEQYEKNAKLYRGAGVLFGVFICVVFI